MADSPSPVSRPENPETGKGKRPQDTVRNRLEGLVGRARWTLWWERAWPLLWLPITIVLVFLTASWLGLWLDASPFTRSMGLGLFTAAFVLSLYPLVRLRLPGRTHALDRLDRDAGLRHGPARTLDDNLAMGSGDPGTRALWELHRKRAEAAVSQLKVAAPRPDMPGRDRFALRAAGVLAVVASAFVAGPEAGTRLGAAFDWRDPSAAQPTFRVDGWIDPPLYTRSPPLMIDLAAGEQRLRAPVKSTVVVRVAGEGDVSITPGPGLTALPAAQNQRADLREQRFTLEGDAELSVRTGLASGVKLRVEAIPDRAPEIAFTGPPEVNARGTFEILYRGQDDYGITAAEALVDKGEGFKGRRSLVPAPQIALTVPAEGGEAAETRAPVDLTNHAWAGARVKMTLLAKDEAGQEGRSETIDFTLPQRPFTKPLAKSLVEQRRKLVLDPDDRRRIQVALDSLLIEPQRFTPQWGVFLGLRAGTERLRRAKTDADLVAVADWLWEMAVQIEDGDLSSAERDLRAAQERLREAMDRNAPNEEIKRLTDELRQAMDRFLREFAERMQQQQRNQQAENQQAPPDRVISQDDLNRMLQQMEEAMRRGDMAEAQKLLEQLRQILENLQTAQPNRTTDPLGREMNQAMQDLDNMAREQQQLRDETFRNGQDQRMQQGERNRQQRQQGQRGQQGQQGQQGQRQQGQRGQQGQQGQQQGQEQADGQQGQEGQGQQGQGGQQGLGQRQQALRERLESLQRRMRGMGMQGEQGLADAEQAMREAEQAIGQGQDGQAVDAQGRALEGLQRGQQGMAQQMQGMQEGEGQEQADGQQPGQQGQQQGRGQASQRDNDPLGRPTRSRDFSDGRVRVPNAGESATQRAQRILEELRRKLGDPMRPREELDYFDRLLRRN